MNLVYLPEFRASPAMHTNTGNNKKLYNIDLYL